MNPISVCSISMICLILLLHFCAYELCKRIENRGKLTSFIAQKKLFSKAPNKRKKLKAEFSLIMPNTREIKKHKPSNTKILNMRLKTIRHLLMLTYCGHINRIKKRDTKVTIQKLK